MNAIQISRDVVLEPADNNRLANLCGQFDEHLRQIERRLGVEIASHGNRFRVTGKPGAAEVGGDVLLSLFEMTDKERLDPEQRAFLERVRATPSVDLERQPPVEGIAAERVRFLYDLETGSYFLAIHADRDRRQGLAFSLEAAVETRVLHPEGAAVSSLQLARRTELELPGGHVETWTMIPGEHGWCLDYAALPEGSPLRMGATDQRNMQKTTRRRNLRLQQWMPAMRVEPKSMIFTVPYRSIMMFSGFRSW